MTKIKDDFLTELSVALADLHFIGYQEGYNAKAMEWNKLYKESNNELLRQEALTNYLLGLKMEKTYKEQGERAIKKITDLLFSIQEGEEK